MCSSILAFIRIWRKIKTGLELNLCLLELVICDPTLLWNKFILRGLSDLKDFLD